MHIFDHKRNAESLEELKAELVDEKLRRYESNLLRHVTGTNSSGMAKVVLNCRPNARRRLGRPSKRLLDEAETGLSRHDWCRRMIMIMIMNIVYRCVCVCVFHGT